jgi:DNA-binding response OmpR family regulator
MKKILLIEDDPDTSLLVTVQLESQHYEVVTASDGIKGLVLLHQHNPDLVVLDLMLPEIDGIEVCRRIRSISQVPILMLTTKSAISKRVEGLDAGANDYLTKPFHVDEFFARVRAQLRIGLMGEMRLRYADLVLDTQTREVWRAGKSINLSAKEFDLLVYFLRHPNQVLSKPRILESVWHWDFEGDDNIIEVYIHNLRRKLQTAHDQPKLLYTVRGAGYALRSEPGI